MLGRAVSMFLSARAGHIVRTAATMTMRAEKRFMMMRRGDPAT
jgi:hypothetical protein